MLRIAGFLIMLAAGCGTLTAQEFAITGKLADVNNTPVPDANVMVYMLDVDEAANNVELAAKIATVSDANGNFSVKTGKPAQMTMNIISTRKGDRLCGYSMQYSVAGTKPLEITMYKPVAVTGTVTDDTNSPVASGKVSIIAAIIDNGRRGSYFISPTDAVDVLCGKTDESGRFSIDGVPEPAMVDLQVESQGRPTFSTFGNNGRPGSYKTLEPIKLVVPSKGGDLRVTVVNDANGNPLAGLHVSLHSRMGPVRPMKSVTDANGIARFESLVSNTYNISINDGFSREDAKKGKLPKWAPVNEKVDIKAGETENLDLRMSTGGVIEVTVLDSKKLPVKEVIVIAHNPTGAFSGSSGITDANGIARIRVIPGSYQVQLANARKSEQVEVEQGQTAKLTIESKNPVKITGITRDRQGKPVAGAKVSVPWFGWTSETDTQGQFTLDTANFGVMDNEAKMLVIRHLERNLAAVIEIDEDANQLEIILEKGLTARGIVNDINDKPIAGVTMNVTVWTGNRGWSLNDGGVKTDANGCYSINALVPERRYSFNARAEGYGSGYSKTSDATEAETRIIEVEPISLKFATLTVNGIVVDENDMPIEGADVQCYGQQQANVQTKSDKQGRFTLAKVCEGELNLSAYRQGQGESLNGWLRTTAPAEDEIKLVLKRPGRGGNSSNEEILFKSLKNKKKLPEFQGDILGIDVNSIAGKKLVLCFFDMNQRPSRFAVRELARLKTEIEAQGATVVLVQAANSEQGAAEKWLKEQNVPFGAGVVQGDTEKVRGKWGVKGLPWIVVADKSDKVIAEGISPTQVTEMIK